MEEGTLVGKDELMAVIDIGGPVTDAALLEFVDRNRHLLKQVKTRKLCADLLANLDWFVDKCDGVVGKFIDVPALCREGMRRLQSDLWELKYWGLIAPGEKKGEWCLTELGLGFYEGRTMVPVGLRIHDDQVIGEYGGRWNYMSALNAATKS